MSNGSKLIGTVTTCLCGTPLKSPSEDVGGVALRLRAGGVLGNIGRFVKRSFHVSPPIQSYAKQRGHNLPGVLPVQREPAGRSWDLSDPRVLWRLRAACASATRRAAAAIRKSP